MLPIGSVGIVIGAVLDIRGLTTLLETVIDLTI
jgi:hypothetical protein